MNFKEIIKLPKEDLEKKNTELRSELMKLSAQVAIGTTPKSTKQIRELKRTLAKIETLKTQNFKKELAALNNNSAKSEKSKIKKYYHS